MDEEEIGILGKIAWSHNGWKEFDYEGYNPKDRKNYGYRYVKENGFGWEWWNFYGGFNDEYYYGYIPDETKNFKKGPILFISKDINDKKTKFVGFYGEAELGDYQSEINIDKFNNDNKNKLEILLNEGKINQEEYNDLINKLIINKNDAFIFKARKNISTVFDDSAYINIKASDIGIVKIGQSNIIYIKDKRIIIQLLDNALKKHKDLLNDPKISDDPLRKSKIEDIIEKINNLKNRFAEYSSNIQNNDSEKSVSSDRINQGSQWWVETAKDKDHKIPGSNQYDIGFAIWCPQKWEDNKDRCKIRYQIKKGDKVLHIEVDKKTIIGVSIVENGYEEFEIPQGTKWSKNGPTKGFIIKLKEFKKLSKEINWEELKKNKEEELKKIPLNEWFYDKDLNFKRGKYLNELSPDLLKIINEEYKKISNENLPYYTDEVSPEVSPEPPNKSTLDAILENKNQVILYGPPGTGKTYIAKKYIEYNTNKDNKRYQVITFHPSYSYEEFVEGIRPKLQNDDKIANDHITFEIEEGIFKKLCTDAYNAIIDAFNNSSKNEKLEEWKENQSVPLRGKDSIKDFYEKNKNKIAKYYLLIDEINRGDISKIFGELITLLEKDKRLFSDNEMVLKLPYSKTDFGVPPNLYIIGTMNTADRSIALLDVALRRRFGFIEIMPDPEQLKLNETDSEITRGLKEDLGDSADQRNFLKTLLENLNSKIAYNLDRDHQIGHAYFIKLTKINNYDEFIEKLKEIWFYEIIPLLQEYFYNNTDKLKEIIGPFMEITDSNNENKTYKIKSIGDFNKDADFLKDLAKIGSNSGENTE